jgi:class 3 adenylate cyclase
MHYTVVGDPVNVASRLQTAAGPGQILVDELTHDRVSPIVASQDLGSLRLAGKGDWVHAFNVLALQTVEHGQPGQ